MLTTLKLICFGAIIASLGALSGCASQAPRVSNAALGYAVTTYAVAADQDEEELSGALGLALHGVGIATAMPAKADVTIDFVRYNSPIIGLFYGGQHYTSLSVTLTDTSGAKIENFSVYVAANGNSGTANRDLASDAANIIAAKAANAFMPMKAMPKAIAMEPEIEIVAPAATEPAEEAVPCVIGPDGKCLVL
jgi:hypothetical protein